MSKKAFDKIAGGIKEAIAITRGTAKTRYRAHVPAEIDVAAVRKKTGLSQGEFSLRFGIPVGTLRDWEQKRRDPDGAARVLLTVIDREPKAVARALELSNR
jgi:putative transcriptional regulator